MNSGNILSGLSRIFISQITGYRFGMVTEVLLITKNLAGNALKSTYFGFVSMAKLQDALDAIEEKDFH